MTEAGMSGIETTPGQMTAARVRPGCLFPAVRSRERPSCQVVEGVLNLRTGVPLDKLCIRLNPQATVHRVGCVSCMPPAKTDDDLEGSLQVHEGKI